ncbi:MAG TPA: hypothetical protein VLI45_01945 [Acidobacteriaceae bacterium]|nr:hypothetical protein [Acidobacteriaceae bacterium]
MGRAAFFAAVVVFISLVGDGWSGRPSPLAHQLLLLPFTGAFLFSAWELLFGRGGYPGLGAWMPRHSLLLCVLFELTAGLLLFYDAHHFSRFGYRVHPIGTVLLIAICTTLLAIAAVRACFARRFWILSVVIGAFVAGRLFSIWSFPLTYLRSDMLPVINAADQQILRHASPYALLHLGTRIYAFPYLPGMLVAYLPFAAMHIDLRLGSLVYMLVTVLLIVLEARRPHQLQVIALLAVFLLSPFLQYRHELYIQPHWFALILAIVFMRRSRFGWAAFVFGISMAVYQFSWILFPFVLLNAYWRRRWPEAAKLALLGGIGALLVAGPFLRATTNRIADNTVSQWGRLAHANADAMNLSYWATYIIPTHRLLWLQAILMAAIFAHCVLRGRCRDLTDTLRWMSVALITFVLFNVIVDGYFYLMISILLLAYTCVANGWWGPPESKMETCFPALAPANAPTEAPSA